MDEILLITRSMRRSLLGHFRCDFDTRYTVRARWHVRLDIDRVHIVIIMRRHVACVEKTLGPVCGCLRPGNTSPPVAVGWHELGEDQGDDGSEEWERGANNRDVAFCCCPIGCTDVTVYGGC